MAIEAINSGRPDQGELKKQIRERIKTERAESGRIFIPTVSDEAVNLAFDTLRKVAKKWKKGEKARLRFRSIKQVRQGFIVQRCASGGQIFPRQLDRCHITEDLTDVKGQTVRVTVERGRWFVCYKQTLLLSENQAAGRPAAIDPGVRTFATVYGSEDVVKYGEGFSVELQKLSHQHDHWRSIRDKLPKTNDQWVRDRHRHCRKKMDRIANRMHDLIDDLHWRTGVDIVRSHDVILLPTFETSQMSRRKNDRKIRIGTVRSLLSMSFFKFSQRLEWLCRKYGKTLIRVNESYTSKTDSRTGEIKNIGGSKTINGLDRDTNGARGILLRALSRAA